MLIRSINLVVGYPTGRENTQRAWLSFNGSTPGALHRDPIWGDSCYPVVWARSRAEGNLQVFKLRVRSCRRWQLKVCNQFYELFAARHAPWVSLPASNPGRPQEVLNPGILHHQRWRVPGRCHSVAPTLCYCDWEVALLRPASRALIRHHRMTLMVQNTRV